MPILSMMATLQDTIYKIEIRDNAESRHEIIENASLPDDARLAALAAEFLIIPTSVGRERTELAFPTGTDQLFLDLQASLGRDMVALVIAPDAYLELDLHSDKLRLPKFSFREDSRAIFLGVIASILANQVSSPKPPSSVELSILFEQTSGQCVDINIAGPPDAVTGMLKDAMDRCSGKDKRQSGQVPRPETSAIPQDERPPQSPSPTRPLGLRNDE